jgi:hypothetical protein
MVVPVAAPGWVVWWSTLGEEHLVDEVDGGSALPGRRIGAGGAGKVAWSCFGGDTVIVHKGDLDRQAGLEVGQGAAQDAIS